MGEYKKMAAWLESNPAKRPKSRYARFVNNWLSRAAENKRKLGADDWRSKIPSVWNLPPLFPEEAEDEKN